ncbi:MAG: SAM-dependent methyltransferase [Acidimicrobiaceae bacterium]|nr:SAM-dependent methyltransferase [Acidimicrobiaceae bacterium]
MEGYDRTTYGEAFADVYDDWYADVSDVAATTSTLTELALDRRPTARVLELGVGSGRLAVPLAADHRLSVVGIDASPAMLALARDRDPDRRVTLIEGDMVADLPPGPFDLVLVAYNTLFNLTAVGEQARCFAAVADRLEPGGRFVVEAFVPDEPAPSGDVVAVRSMSTDRVVLSISRQDAARQIAEGQFVEFTEAGGVRLRPWSIRYATPHQLDAIADAAGFDLEARWADMTRAAPCDDDDRHVTVYRRRDHDRATIGARSRRS